MFVEGSVGCVRTRCCTGSGTWRSVGAPTPWRSHAGTTALTSAACVAAASASTTPPGTAPTHVSSQGGNFYSSATKLRIVNIFSRVCLSIRECHVSVTRDVLDITIQDHLFPQMLKVVKRMPHCN